MKIRILLTVVLFLTVLTMNGQVDSRAEVLTIYLNENGNYPNSKLPVLLYKSVFHFENTNAPELIEKIFTENGWSGMWRNGIYDFHHYHSTAHEALGVYNGWAEVQLGGPKQNIVRLEKGDLVILPAGISHKRIDSGSGFAVVGAYPNNQRWDMNYGKVEEVKTAKKNILGVALPTTDPVYGTNGKLFDYWK